MGAAPPVPAPPRLYASPAVETHASPIWGNGGRGATQRRRGRNAEQGRPFQNGTRCLRTKHESGCQRPVAGRREKLSRSEVGLGVPCAPLLDSLEKPGIPRAPTAMTACCCPSTLSIAASPWRSPHRLAAFLSDSRNALIVYTLATIPQSEAKGGTGVALP
jgi:hypothetical protein